MKPLNRVTFVIVHRSGGSSDVKSCHCDLKDMCNVCRPIIGVDNRRYTPVRNIISDQVFDDRFSLLVLYRPGGKPSGIDVNDCEERGVSLFCRLYWPYKIKTYFFSRTAYKVMSISMTLRSLSGKMLATGAHSNTNSLQTLVSLGKIYLS